MAYEKRDNSGSLFKNDRKAQPSHADYQGKIMVAGVEYYLNAWLKDGQKGKFFSLSVKPVGDAKPATSKPTAQPDPFSDDIPF